MNERIKALAEQAQKEVWGNNSYNGSPEFEGYELDTEKFAELIVRECSAYLNGAMEVHNQQEQDLMDLAARKIKEHFGVE